MKDKREERKRGEGGLIKGQENKVMVQTDETLM